MQSLGEIELRAPTVGAKIVFLVCHAARRGHSSNKYCVTVDRSILMQFSAPLSERPVLSDALHSSYICC